MAASLSYKVNGSADTKPLSQVQKGIDKISKSAKALNIAVGGFVIGKVMQGVSKVVSGSTTAFMNQNKAATAANKAFTNNSKLSAESVRNIKSAMDGFSLNNFIDGDTLNNAAALASNMGLNEEQIIKVMDAARDLSAATGQDLNSCVKQLAQSYDGNVASLKKLAPELGNLTAEELKNGAAIDAIKKKYDGFSETMSNTFDGRNKQFENTFGDLQASIGGVFQALKFVGQGQLMQPLKESIAFIEGHRDQIINFFLNLPEIAGVAFATIRDVIIRTYDNLPDLGAYLIGSIKAWLPVVGEFMKAVGEVIIGVLDVTFGNLGRLFYNKVIISIKEAIQDLINNFVKEHPNIAGFLKLDKIQLDMTQKAYSTFSSYTSKAAANIDKAKQNAQEAVKKQNELNNNFASKYADITSNANRQISAILNKDLPADLKKAFEQGGEAIAETINENFDFEAAQQGRGAGIDTSKAESGLTTLTSIIQTLGDVGQAVALALESNFIGLILMLIAKLVSALSESSSKFSAFMDSIGTVMGFVADIIAPLVEEVIQPFLDGMEALGTIIGNLLKPLMTLINQIVVPIFNLLTQIIQILAPIIELIGNLLTVLFKVNPVFTLFQQILKIFGDILKAVYNYVLVPVVNFLLKIITSIGNFFIKMYNGVVSVLNGISIFGYHPFHISKASELSYSDMKLEKISDYSTYNDPDTNPDNVKGGSASYTAQKDVYVNIYFNSSYVNGDAESIAINLAREIKRAESKNLI